MSILDRRNLLAAGGLLSAGLVWAGCSMERSNPAGSAPSPGPSGVTAISARKTMAQGGDRSEYEGAIARIRAVGGSVERRESDPDRPVVAVFLEGPRVSDEDLGNLERFLELQRLSLLDASISDSGLDHLRGLDSLRWLYLSRTPVTDRGLVRIAGLVQIEELGLHHTRISDDGLAHLGRLERLRILDIKYTSTTDAGLAHLEGHTELRKLDLRGTQVTDAGMKNLRRLTRLWSLNLAATRVGDSGMADLEALTQLQELDLGETRITDAGLEHLQRMSNLQVLNVTGTAVTDSGLERIRKVLPEATMIKEVKPARTGPGQGAFVAPGEVQRGPEPIRLVPDPLSCPLAGAIVNADSKGVIQNLTREDLEFLLS